MSELILSSHAADLKKWRSWDNTRFTYSMKDKLRIRALPKTAADDMSHYNAYKKTERIMVTTFKLSVFHRGSDPNFILVNASLPDSS